MVARRRLALCFGCSIVFPLEYLMYFRCNSCVLYILWCTSGWSGHKHALRACSGLLCAASLYWVGVALASGGSEAWAVCSLVSVPAGARSGNAARLASLH